MDPNALGNSSNPPSSTGESTLIRGRSLKKSLRESFRRLRKGRTIKKATMLPTNRRPDENNPLSPANIHLEDVIRVPVERQVEFREFKPMDDQVISMVRCLYFAKTYLNSGTCIVKDKGKKRKISSHLFILVNDRTRSLWAGTNGGHVYVYSITGVDTQIANSATNGPNNAAAIATDQTTSCTMGLYFVFIDLTDKLNEFSLKFLAKEIRLKHKAPVLSIAVLDSLSQSVGQGSAIPIIESTPNQQNAPVQTNNTTENVSPTSTVAATSHKVLICSEEQFKVL